jgi:hypothetical protein
MLTHLYVRWHLSANLIVCLFFLIWERACRMGSVLMSQEGQVGQPCHGPDSVNQSSRLLTPCSPSTLPLWGRNVAMDRYRQSRCG